MSKKTHFNIPVEFDAAITGPRAKTVIGKIADTLQIPYLIATEIFCLLTNGVMQGVQHLSNSAAEAYWNLFMGKIKKKAKA